METYFNIKLWVEYIIPLGILGLIILYVLLYILISFIKSLFCKNCFKCKHYKLYNVAGSGDCCWYRCDKLDITNSHSMNDTVYYKKCKYYEEEESNNGQNKN